MASKPLRKYPSSNGRTEYTVSWDEDKQIYWCDCPGWRFSDPDNRTCKHLKMFNSTDRQHIEPSRPSPCEDELSLDDLINGEVNKIKGAMA